MSVSLPPSSNTLNRRFLAQNVRTVLRACLVRDTRKTRAYPPCTFRPSHRPEPMMSRPRGHTRLLPHGATSETRWSGPSSALPPFMTKIFLLRLVSYLSPLPPVPVPRAAFIHRFRLPFCGMCRAEASPSGLKVPFPGVCVCVIDNAICTPEPTSRAACGALQHGYLSHSTTKKKKSSGLVGSIGIDFRVGVFVTFDIVYSANVSTGIRVRKKVRELPRCELAALARSLRTQLVVGNESCFLGLEQRSRSVRCRFHRPLYGKKTAKLCKTGICIASGIAKALDLAFSVAARSRCVDPLVEPSLHTSYLHTPGTEAARSLE